MEINRIQIKSVKDADTPHSWFEFDINENARSIVALTVTADNDVEGPDISDTAADLAGNNDLSKPLVVSHTTSGLEVWERSPENEPDGLLSNLAYWDPNTDTLTVYEFVER